MRGALLLIKADVSRQWIAGKQSWKTTQPNWDRDLLLAGQVLYHNLLRRPPSKVLFGDPFIRPGEAGECCVPCREGRIPPLQAEGLRFTGFSQDKDHIKEYSQLLGKGGQIQCYKLTS